MTRTANKIWSIDHCLAFSDSPSKVWWGALPRPRPMCGSDRTPEPGDQPGPGAGARHEAFRGYFCLFPEYNLLAARIALSRWKLLSRKESEMLRTYVLAANICISGIFKVLTIRKGSWEKSGCCWNQSPLTKTQGANLLNAKMKDLEILSAQAGKFGIQEKLSFLKNIYT